MKLWTHVHETKLPTFSVGARLEPIGSCWGGQPRTGRSRGTSPVCRDSARARSARLLAWRASVHLRWNGLHLLPPSTVALAHGSTVSSQLSSRGVGSRLVAALSIPVGGRVHRSALQRQSARRVHRCARARHRAHAAHRSRAQSLGDDVRVPSVRSVARLLGSHLLPPRRAAHGVVPVDRHCVCAVSRAGDAARSRRATAWSSTRHQARCRCRWCRP